MISDPWQRGVQRAQVARRLGLDEIGTVIRRLRTDPTTPAGERATELPAAEAAFDRLLAAEAADDEDGTAT
jgi:hypothetical protein